MRSAISVISNLALTGSRTSTSSPSLRNDFTNSCKLFAGTLYLPYSGLDAGRGAFFAFARDDAQELRQVRHPELQRDGVAARDLTRPIPDHAARHPDEAWLVQARYGLDRPGIGVVPDEDRVIGRGPGRVVRLEPLRSEERRVGKECRSRW